MSATHTSAPPDYAPVPQSALHPAQRGVDETDRDLLLENNRA
jgi:hypothetical protein